MTAIMYNSCYSNNRIFIPIPNLHVQCFKWRQNNSLECLQYTCTYTMIITQHWQNILQEYNFIQWHIKVLFNVQFYVNEHGYSHIFTPNSFPSLQLVCCYIKIADSIEIQLLTYTWRTTNVNNSKCDWACKNQPREHKLHWVLFLLISSVSSVVFCFCKLQKEVH